MSLLADQAQGNNIVKRNLDGSVGILGVPLGFGASMAGVDMGPAALRVAKLHQRIAELGYSVTDFGDLHPERPQTFAAQDDKLKYLAEISKACEQLAVKVEEILASDRLPVVLGGDHSIAIGSFAGVASFYRKKQETIG